MINIFRDVVVFGYLNFYLEVFFALSVLVWHVKRRPEFLVRLIGCQILASLLYFLPAIDVGMGISLSYILVLCLLVLELLFLFKMDVFTAIFYGVAGFAMQNMAWSFFMLLIQWIDIKNLTQLTGILLYIGSYLFTYAFCFIYFGRRKLVRGAVKPNFTNLIIVTVIVLLIYLLSAIISHVKMWSSYSRLYSILCCFLALCCQFGVFQNSHLQDENLKLAQDNAITKELIEQGGKQRQMTQDVIEIIDLKCHDLKRQISILRNLGNEERERQIDKIENAVMLYGNIAKTGNYVLDIILTEKSLICENRKIKFSYIAEGDSLSHLDSADVVCLLGNILDNAIDSVVREEEERRVIKLNIATNQNMLSISCENYCGHQVTFLGGLPVSEKENKQEHGYGVKSIRYIVEQYGGNMVIKQEEDLFSVNIMIPIGQ